MTVRNATMIRLSDSDKAVADPSLDIRGRIVKDIDGSDVGRIDDLLIDADEQRIRFLLVEHGGILGFGATPSYIPVDAVVEVTADEVRIDRTSGHVAGTPGYDPDLVDHDDDYYANVYGHYGLSPYWAPGYTYPMRPYLF
ncbi:PRC-barrel domain-containing protein [Actinoplanes rectilineatus]|uniref:PRC-barrel domain-containing protein n=1 Tax=Actinoplanes rectilineatus TaxID=113571 RepID=UPI0005F288EB|nr:PRC-barrel domain-containing protein [Actinoplanes rectilineatus]